MNYDRKLIAVRHVVVEASLNSAAYQSRLYSVLLEEPRHSGY
jgi:hypothetical protein